MNDFQSYSNLALTFSNKHSPVEQLLRLVEIAGLVFLGRSYAFSSLDPSYSTSHPPFHICLTFQSLSNKTVYSNPPDKKWKRRGQQDEKFSESLIPLP